MKHFLMTLLAGMVTVSGFSQSDKYLKAMEAQMVNVDTVITTTGSLEMANTFQRIADAEKTQWLPYYYAALSHTMAGYHALAEPSGSQKADTEADKAEELLKKAEGLTKENSEIFVVKKMINTLRLSADPQNRYMTFGPAAQEALDKPKQLNPANPRVTLLEAQDTFFPPEQYGGSKSEAKTILEDAIKKFDAFKPESSIAPHWGLRQAQWLYSQCK